MRSRENLKGRVVLALESTGARMSRLGRVACCNELPILSVDEMIERIDAVGIAELRELAGELFAPAAPVGRRRRARRGGVPRGDRAARRPALGATRGVARAAGRDDPGGRRRRGRAHGRRRSARRSSAAEDMELVGRADPLLGDDARGGAAPSAEVVVDFTPPDTALDNALACVRAGVHVVIGTTGFDPAPLRPGAAAEGRPQANVLIAPNFAIGAVLMMRFAAEAAAAHGERGDHRAAPRRQARRAQRHGGAHRRADGRRPAAGTSRRRSTRCACPGWSPTRR